MRSKRRQQPPLQTSIKLFGLGVLLLIAAFVFPLISVSCTNEGSFQFCTETTYYGMDAHTFGIVLGILAVLSFVGGVFYLMRHKQTLEAPKSGGVSSAPQPFVPPQPGAYPSAQNTSSSGSYRGDVPSQPPSNSIPRT